MGSLTCVSFFAERARKPSWGGQGKLTLIWKKNVSFFPPIPRKKENETGLCFWGLGFAPKERVGWLYCSPMSSSCSAVLNTSEMVGPWQR